MAVATRLAINLSIAAMIQSMSEAMKAVELRGVCPGDLEMFCGK